MADKENETVRVSIDKVNPAGRRLSALQRADGEGDKDDPLDDRVAKPLPSLDLEDLGLEIQVSTQHLASLMEKRLESVSQVFTTLGAVKVDLDKFLPAVPENLPPSVSGRLVNPDGSDAGFVSVRALEPQSPTTTSSGEVSLRLSWPNPETKTDRRGSFRLTLPSRPIPDSGITLLVVGANRTLELDLRRIDLIAGNGSLGVLPLEAQVQPLRRSVVAQLGDVVIPTEEDDLLTNPEDFADPVPVMTLGEGDCARSFRSNLGIIDRFRYSMLVRLVAPELSGRRLGTRIKRGDRNSMILSASSAGLTKYLGTDQIVEAMGLLGSWELVQRTPIEAPIDVGRFLDTVERNPKAVPKAATLALGYVVKMHQLWIPTGLSLGDLVYSLPLAPGEQQRIAISDERETLSVREQEALTAEEFQRYNEAANSSTNSVFNSAFDEAASGGSRMKVNTEAGSFGAGLGIGAAFGSVVAGLGIGGGYSDSTTTGSTSSWQNASRDYVSSASQDFHSSLARQASARRQATRTSVRLASSSERQEVVTKVITNHNHNHALTMQYWEVLRHFGVSSSVDDVQLVCFVPLEVIQFIPSDVPRMLPTGSYSRNSLLHRYEQLLRHHDVLASRIWWRPELAHGLRVLRSFAGNPTMTVESSSGSAQDIVNVSISGGFLPFEDIYCTAISTTGARVGPIRLAGASAAVPGGFETRAALLHALRTRRENPTETRVGSLALPSYLSRSNVARMEFSRSFRTFSYRLTLPSGLSFTDILGYLSNTAALDVTMTSDELERELNGPVVSDPSASIGGVVPLLESYNGPGGSERMPVVMPVAARRLAPEVSFADLLRIEALLQHVVQNTVEYSKAVWQSLTPEERAIMLEQYTIGVPTGGVADPSDEVPLLNCVANQVLGYFGNAAIMPFFIPALLADEVGYTSRDIQEALLKFHRQAYLPARSSITLPARGVLGEAVLGSCDSSEKIDLTRFWNWQDSPADSATDPAQLAALFAGGNQLVGPGGATAPAGLQTGPMVTINQGPTAMTPAELGKALIESMPESNIPKDLTGITQLGAQMKVQTETTAESLNKTIAEASGLAKAAMTALPGAIQASRGQGTGAGTGSGTGTGTGGTGTGTGGTGTGTGGTGTGGTGTGGTGTGGTGTGGTGTGGTGTGGTGTGGTGTGGTGTGGTGTGGTGTGPGGTGTAIDGGAAPPP